MRQLLWLCVLAAFMPMRAKAQVNDLPDRPFELHYTIYGSIHDSAHTVTGLEKMTITNLTDAPMDTVYLKLYPNAYSSDSTRLSDHLLDNQDLRFYFWSDKEKGAITQLDFTSKGQRLAWNYIDVTKENVKVLLPGTLQPGDSLEIQTPFFLKLPSNITGYGYTKDRWALTKWYPELAGWTKEKGWDLSTLTDYSQISSLSADFTVYLSSGLRDEMMTNGELMDAKLGADQKLSIFQAKSIAGFDLVLGLDGTPVSQDNRLEADQKERGSATAGTATGVDKPGALFKKLLPGPLSGKRPVHPDTVLAQTRAQLLGVRGPDLSKPLKPAFLLNLKHADSLRYLSFSPAVGYNDYDKLMAGIMIHNYQLPLNRFNFLVAPMISPKTHQIAGLATLNYRIPQPGQLWQFSLNGSRYAYNTYADYSDAAGTLHPGGQMELERFVPAITFTKYTEPGNFRKGWDLGLKAFILKADNWSVSGNDLSMANSTTVIGEFKAARWDKRALYPYRIDFKVDGTKDYVKLGLTGKYFLNYDGEGNGLQLRGFAGKFFYLKGNDPLAAFNYGNAFLSLSGVDGDHDYTYSHYFVGRSAFDGWMSQQIAVEDGFFKVATPSLQDPIGISDNWLAAVNLTTDIPKNINPFALLPFRLPVRAFLDLGTYSQAWEDNPATGRFLYDAGLQVSVLKEAVTVYFPLLYSKVYRDYYKSMGYNSYFVHTIRFSINLEKLKPRVLDRIINR